MRKTTSNSVIVEVTADTPTQAASIAQQAGYVINQNHPPLQLNRGENSAFVFVCIVRGQQNELVKEWPNSRI